MASTQSHGAEQAGVPAEWERDSELVSETVYAMVKKLQRAPSQKEAVSACVEAISLTKPSAEEPLKYYLGRRCVATLQSFHALRPSENFRLMARVLATRLQDERWYELCTAIELTPRYLNQATRTDEELAWFVKTYAALAFPEKAADLDFTRVEIRKIAAAALGDFPDGGFATALAAFGRCLAEPVGQIATSLK